MMMAFQKGLWHEVVVNNLHSRAIAITPSEIKQYASGA